MNAALEKQLKSSFGFNPVESAHHFLLEIRPAAAEPVYISEHISWDDELGSCATTLDNRLDGQLRVLLPRPKWDALADELRAVFNTRLRKQGQTGGTWRQGFNLLRRDLGKELLLLAWAVEDAEPALLPNALLNWKGLLPEERWWLYTQTAAASGHATQGRGLGWRKALRFALTENPVQNNSQHPREYYVRALNNGPHSDPTAQNATQKQLFLNEAPAPGRATKTKKTPTAKKEPTP